MSQAGSYKANEFSNLSTELERLKKQALTFQKLEVSVLRDWVGVQKTHSLLEVGCGPGFITPALVDLVSEGRVVACDTSRELLEIAKSQKISAPKKGLEFLLSEGDALPADKNSMDFAYLRFVMQHVPNNENLLAQVLSVLSPGGKACLLDTDDGLNIHYPKSELLEQIVHDSQKKQSEKGGDRFAGRSLGVKMAQMGYRNIRTKIVQFTPSDLPFAALATIAFGFKAELCGLKSDLMKWIQDNDQKSKDGAVFISAGAVVAVGEKG